MQQPGGHLKPVILQILHKGHSHGLFKVSHKMGFGKLCHLRNIRDTDFLCIMILYIFQYDLHLIQRLFILRRHCQISASVI